MSISLPSERTIHACSRATWRHLNSPLLPAVLLFRVGHIYVCVVGKRFDTVRAAVDLMRERKEIKKVTVGEVTLISRSSHKIPAAFPPSKLKFSRNCLAVRHLKESCNGIVPSEPTGLQRCIRNWWRFPEKYWVVIFWNVSGKLPNLDKSSQASYYCTHSSIYLPPLKLLAETLSHKLTL